MKILTLNAKVVHWLPSSAPPVTMVSLAPALLLACLLARTGTAFQVLQATRSTSNARCSAPKSRLFSSLVDVSDQAARNYDGLIDWNEYYGVTPENFRLNLQSSNWGAEATEAAAAGSRVLFVPGELRLTSSAAREQDFANLEPVIAQYIDGTTGDGDIDLDRHFYLFLKVLQEYDQGDQSPYFLWLDALPRKFDTSLSFSEFEVDCLPPFVKFLSQTDRQNYDLFLTTLDQLDTPTITDATKANAEVTKWAFNVVLTRARPAFGEAEIIPMSDMLNHAWDANVEVQYDEEGNVHVTLLRDVQAGEPLHKCYGQPTNPSRFLATYGFFDTTPPATYCKLLPQLAVTPELQNLGFEYDRMLFYVEDGGIAEEVWDVVLYLTLADIDTDQQQQFYDAHMSGDADTKASFHQHYMADSTGTLLTHVTDMLEEIADCENTMDQGGMGLIHENLPVIRRHNNFVRQVFIKVQKSLEQIQASLA